MKWGGFPSVRVTRGFWREIITRSSELNRKKYNEHIHDISVIANMKPLKRKLRPCRTLALPLESTSNSCDIES